jgi:hypothetical protein
MNAILYKTKAPNKTINTVQQQFLKEAGKVSYLTGPEIATYSRYAINHLTSGRLTTFEAGQPCLGRPTIFFACKSLQNYSKHEGVF